MSPERLIREPWRLALFFVAVFGALIACLGTILWQQAAVNLGTRRNQALILLALQKSDRNNQTIKANTEATRKTYEAGRKTRAHLTAMVAEEKRMNLCLLRMSRAQTRMDAAILRALKRRHRR